MITYIILYIGLYGLYMDYNSLSFLKPLSIREMHIQVPEATGVLAVYFTVASNFS